MNKNKNLFNSEVTPLLVYLLKIKKCVFNIGCIICVNNKTWHLIYVYLKFLSCRKHSQVCVSIVFCGYALAYLIPKNHDYSSPQFPYELMPLTNCTIISAEIYFYPARKQVS